MGLESAGDIMSAVCGIIIQRGKESDLIEQGISMMDKLCKYKFDSMKHINKNNVFMGCGMQYITPESFNEVLPFYDEKKGYMVTADAIIDNREELYNLLNIQRKLWSSITDSELILRAYEKWDKKCPEYLIGDFAFAIWDEKRKELFCARDHVGKRTFYYYLSGSKFAFCTVIKPLFSACDKEITLNERWITDYLALDGLLHETECNETVYKDIYQLPPAYTITLNEQGLKKTQYWDPIEEVKPLKLKSDKEYYEAFRKVFFEAVYCRLRSSSEVGIMLSGGLDSGSVACAAGERLSRENKRLKAFSSIPMKGYNDNLPKYYAADESEYIEAIKNKIKNMDLTYCRCEGKDAFTDIDFFIDILEQPYKIFQNIYWYDEIVEKASKNGCRVLLNGQFGNGTISYGNFFINILTLYRKAKFVTLFKEIKGMSNLANISACKVFKEVIRVISPYKLRKMISSIRNRDYDRFYNVPVNPDLIKKWNVEKRFDEEHYNQLTEKFYDLYESHKYVVNPLTFSHVSAIETKISLARGIVIRDPTRDKRVIEFCLSLPGEQYVRNGQERYLIRRSMEGILPDKIRLNVSRRGLQSADWIQRIKPEWSSIRSQLEKFMENETIKKYIDCDKVKSKLESLGDLLDKKNENTVQMLLMTLIFSEFINSFTK